MAGALPGLSSAIRSGVEARRLKALNAALESRLAVRTMELRQALDAASARSLDLAAARVGDKRASPVGWQSLWTSRR